MRRTDGQYHWRRSWDIIIAMNILLMKCGKERQINKVKDLLGGILKWKTENYRVQTAQ